MEYHNSFMEKSLLPTDKMVGNSLGKCYSHWKTIQNHISDNFGQTTPEWKFYSPKYGWTLKTLLKKRNLFFITFSESCFRIAFVFGDKAVDEVVHSNLPEEIKTSLMNEKKYAEGRGFRMIVKTKKDFELVRKLIDIKIKN